MSFIYVNKIIIKTVNLVLSFKLSECTEFHLNFFELVKIII